MSQADVKIALLIDADNAPASKIEPILSELAKYGVANVRRAYGNWKSPTLKPWEDALHEYAIRPIQQFDYSKGKNATDISLVIDAMDLLYTQKLDAFCIVSSDSDFTPLIMRILTNGLKVYGFGEKKTPVPFVNACSIFTYLEALEPVQEETELKPQTPTQSSLPMPTVPLGPSQTNQKLPLKSDTKLMNLLRSAVDATISESGWSLMAAVGTHISNQASFDCRNYGFTKLSDLFQACDLFETTKNQKGSLVVRRRQKQSTLPLAILSPTKPTMAVSNAKDQLVSKKDLEETYAQMLKTKGWERFPKFLLMNFFRVMKNTPCNNKQELILHALKVKPAATENNVKKAFTIFWKAQLFKIEIALSGEKQIELIDCPDYLERIDNALLSRLVGACTEQNIQIDCDAISTMLYSNYEQSVLQSMIEILKNKIANTNIVVAVEEEPVC